MYRDTQCTWFDALLSCSSTLHAVFNTVVQFPTLNTHTHTQKRKRKWDLVIPAILKQYKTKKCKHWVYVYYSLPLHWWASHLLRVELVELCLLAVSPPQTQHFGLGTVRHIYELLIPPALIDSANVTAQDDAVVTHLNTRKAEERCTECTDKFIRIKKEACRHTKLVPPWKICHQLYQFQHAQQTSAS